MRGRGRRGWRERGRGGKRGGGEGKKRVEGEREGEGRGREGEKVLLACTCARRRSCVEESGEQEKHMRREAGK